MTPTTEETLALLSKGRDLIFFAEKILGVRLNRAQRRWFKRLDRGGEWATKHLVHVAANQIGKTVGVAIVLLWACLYKIGIPIGDPARWFGAPYSWYHLAPKQQQAYLPYKDAKLLLQGQHPAQRDPCLFPQELQGQRLWAEVKLEQYYDGLKFYNGSEAHFRTTEEKAVAILGRRASGISFDEAAFEPHLIEVVNTVLMMRLVASGGPLMLVSTPDGVNDFYEVVAAIQNEGTEVEERVWEAEDGSVLIWSHVGDNVGFGLTQEDVDRMEEGLDPATKEQQLRGAFIEPSEAFFTPVTPIQAAFKKGLPDSQDPKPGHKYVIFWDPSVSSDPTAAIVLDVTKKPWIGVKLIWYAKPRAVTDLLIEIVGVHALYSSAHNRLIGRSVAITGYDSTSMGGAILRQFIGSKVHPSRAVNLAGPSRKIDSLTNLRAALTEDALWLPLSWTRVQRELLNYRLKDDKLQQDLVMALAGATDIAARGFGGAVSRPFDAHARVTVRAPWA